MEEHESKLEKDLKFQEAHVTRTKINQLKNLEEQKVITDLKKNQDEEVRLTNINI